MRKIEPKYSKITDGFNASPPWEVRGGYEKRDDLHGAMEKHQNKLYEPDLTVGDVNVTEKTTYKK